jgi:electron transfer flavoprotein alpha subunit
MAEVLLVALYESEVPPLVRFAQQLQQPYDLLLVTKTSSEPSGWGAETIFLGNQDEVPPADHFCNALREWVPNYSVIAGPATMTGKDLLPRLAGSLNRPMVSDVLAVKGPKTFLRPMYAGNVLAVVSVTEEKYVASVRLPAFSKGALPEGTSKIQTLKWESQGVTKRVSTKASTAKRPDLTQARVVVSGGRPLKDAETFERLIGGLADVLGGAVGATRAAVDAGIAPNELQVGQTGKVVAPDLYIAIGISGSTQHIAGMKDSKVIVAINTDPNAPIFEIADYGLVMDLYEAVPELIEKLKQAPPEKPS